MSAFACVKPADPIEVFHVNKLFLEDTDPKKVNLSIGAYRTDEGKPWVLPVVREAEKLLANDESLNHEYLPILGFEPFTILATQFLLGTNHPAVTEQRAFGVQCLSGTGSLRVGAEFLAKVCGRKIAYASKPTWENHHLVFRSAGFQEVREYRYWNNSDRCLDFNGWKADLESAPEGSVIILHGCAHNPTGMDPTQDQWKEICEIIRKKNLFTFFDVAYQGFASGDPDTDAWSVRYFASQGMELLCAQSFAKNFGLYNERTGNLTVVVSDKAVIAPIKSQITMLIRANWSNPPSHGSKIVHKVLSDPNMKEKWFTHIKEMSGRIMLMRKLLREHLESLGTPGKWNHITEQIGMFSYTGLNEKQVEILHKKHIYLLKSGRISMAGLNKSNVEYVAKSMYEAITGSKL
jgi:aspartate aminotransferase